MRFPSRGDNGNAVLKDSSKDFKQELAGSTAASCLKC